MAKIRVFTDIVPDPSTTGGYVLDQIFSIIAQNHDLEFCIIGSGQPSNYLISEELIAAKFNFLQNPVTNWNLGILTKLNSKLLLKYFHSDIQRISSWVLQEDSRDLPDHQIFVLQSTASIIICEKFRGTTTSYSTISFDPWRWWANSHHVPTSLEDIVSESLEEIYSDGHHLVPNSRWQELFPNSRASFIDLYPVFQKTFYKSRKSQGIQSSINFCFAGKIYALAELNKFIEFMDSKGWMLFNLNVFLHIYGPSSPFSSKNIIYHGNVRPKALAHEIASYDYALLPYPAEDKDEDLRRLSFPSKYLLYLNAGLPVIYIGDTAATVCKFTKLTGITINTDDFLEKFESDFANLLLSREEIKLNIKSLISNEFSEENFFSTISGWLDSVGCPEVRTPKNFDRVGTGLTKLIFNDYVIESKSSKIMNNIYKLRRHVMTPKLRALKILFKRLLKSKFGIKFTYLVAVISIKIYNNAIFRFVFPSNH
jgi:hypothetical protein